MGQISYAAVAVGACRIPVWEGLQRRAWSASSALRSEADVTVPLARCLVGLKADVQSVLLMLAENPAGGYRKARSMLSLVDRLCSFGAWTA